MVTLITADGSATFTRVDEDIAEWLRERGERGLVTEGTLSIDDLHEVRIRVDLEDIEDITDLRDRVALARRLYEVSDDRGTLQSGDIEAIDHSLWLRCGGHGMTLAHALSHV